MAGVKGSQPQNLPQQGAPQPEPIEPTVMPKTAAVAASEPAAVPALPQSTSSEMPQAKTAAPQVSDEELLASLGGDAIPAQTSVSDEDLLASIGHGQTAEEPTVQPWAESSMLEKAGRIADYPGGHIRTGIFEVLGQLANKPVVTESDVEAAMKGAAPGSAEYLKRLGVDEGPSVMIPGTVKRVSLRDAEGLALDIATDPLTAMAKMAKEVPYISKMLGAGGAATEAIGDWIYNSAFRKVDAKLAQKGTEPLSQVMRQGVLTKEAAEKLRAKGYNVPDNLIQAVAGTTANIAEQANAMSISLGKLRQAMYSKADELGALIDLGAEGTFGKAEKVIAKMKADPGLAPQAEALEEMLNRYKQTGKVSLENASTFKTNLYDALPNAAFDGQGKVKRMANQFKMALASDIKDAIVKTGNGAEKGLGDAIDHINNRWGILLESRRPMEKQVLADASKGVGSWIDGVLLGSGHLPVLATKKAMELAGTTAARTHIGKALAEVGRTGFVDAMARKSIQAQRPVPMKLQSDEEIPQE